MKVYIIDKNTGITQQIKDKAISNDCVAIAKGIPPKYKSAISEKELPLVFSVEQAILPDRIETRQVTHEIDMLIKALKEKSIITDADLQEDAEKLEDK